MPPRPLVRRRVWIAAAVWVAIAFALVAIGTGDGAPAPAPAAAPPQPPAPVAASVPLPAPVAASVPPAAVPPAAPTATLRPAASEDELMDRLRADVDANPAAAVALAEEGERRWDAGRYGDERAFLRMRALVHLGDIANARDAARRFYERYPGSPHGRLVFRLTGMRPMPPIGPPE
ncbi:MAG TPA: tetratricopeptide repeat protein [Anaeromyxobacter sp.]|nr:tetratricopeptide repeat protein [Anaeromyxobacter sp.]